MAVSNQFRSFAIRTRSALCKPPSHAPRIASATNEDEKPQPAPLARRRRRFFDNLSCAWAMLPLRRLVPRMARINVAAFDGMTISTATLWETGMADFGGDTDLE